MPKLSTQQKTEILVLKSRGFSITQIAENMHIGVSFLQFIILFILFLTWFIILFTLFLYFNIKI